MKVGIVGAGIMGRLVAFELIHANYDISLFSADDDAEMSCSRAAAGLLSPYAELEKSDVLIYQLGMSALQNHWPSILRRLDADIFFQQLGSLIVCHPKDKPDLVRFIEMIRSKMSTHTFYKPLSHQDLRQLEPALTQFDSAYFLPDEAQLDNQALLSALKKYLQQNQVKWYAKTHVDVIAANTIKIKDEIKHFDVVIDCRGLGAKDFFPDLHGIRGELIWLHAPGVNIQRPVRFIHPRYGLYLVPRPNHHYLVGATEIQAENYGTITVRSTLELLTAVYTIHAGFAEAQIVQTITQCRPTLANYLPQIYYADGLIAVNGLYRHGFLIAPTLAAEILLWLQHGAASLHYPHIGKFL